MVENIMGWAIAALFVSMLVVQMTMDLAFYFVSYLTGVAILKVVTMLQTKYTFLRYGVFKESYKISPTFKKPLAIGVLFWFAFMFVLMVFLQ